MNPQVKQLYSQIEAQLSLLGWDWKHSRIQIWIRRCGFSSHNLLTNKALSSLIRYLREVTAVQSLAFSRGFSWDWIEYWLSTHGGSEGCAKLSVWVELRQYLQELDLEIAF